jgi:dihydrolipoamide dehydrogenase
LLASSHLLHEVKKNSANYGVIVEKYHVDLPKMMAQKDKAVSGLTKGVEGLFKKYKARPPQTVV